MVALPINKPKWNARQQSNGLHLLTSELLQEQRPRMTFRGDINLQERLRILPESKDGHTVVEFIGTDNFNQAWYQRQRFEIDAGRDEEPLLYQPLYEIVDDPTLPEQVPVYRLGPSGVIMEKIQEGGEVKFMSVGQSNFSVPIEQFGVGLEYTKKLVMFNQLWSLGFIERQVGIATNALLNHTHFYPILNFAYAAANQTAASAVGANLVEKYLRTIEDAITNSQEDTTNPRRGPYWLLVAPGNRWLVERALTAVPQFGTTSQSSAINDIRGVIVYNGWTGQRGLKTVTYPGVTTNKGYLISQALRGRNFQSYVKQGLESVSGNPDVSRFILEQTVWDIWFGVYADPIAAVEEISWPTS